MQWRRSLVAASVFVVSACSGADPTELFGPVTQESNPAQPIGGDGSDDGGAGSTSSSSGGGSSSSSSSGGSSSSSGGNPPGATPDAGSTPQPGADGCIAENEPNDGPTETNWFTSCFTGSLKKGDHDYASISAPLTAKRVVIDHDEDNGGVLYRLYINGVVYDTFAGDPPRFVPVFGGATYMFEMSPSGGSNATRTYKLEVKFE